MKPCHIIRSSRIFIPWRVTITHLQIWLRVCGRLVKAEYSPPFSDYSVLDENFNYVNYSENRHIGYQYIVVNKWGLQLEEPIQVSFNGN